MSKMAKYYVVLKDGAEVEQHEDRVGAEVAIDALEAQGDFTTSLELHEVRVLIRMERGVVTVHKTRTRAKKGEGKGKRSRAKAALE